ncbi:SsgA family sporulation/cell division regulator [Amycolatopsis thailandensis]|uniref:SsgA family sporulation/cell division regulator n=1 Tax=Amycolatopsis thailandensis TaxID=589330 RepID=UPI00378975B7
MKLQIFATIGDERVPVNFRYLKADPYAVAMTPVTRMPVTWLFGRDLLRAGLDGPVGKGDVCVTSGLLTVIVLLRNGGQSSPLIFDRSEMENLVQLLDKLVPFGKERIDWSKASDLFPGIELADTVEGGA